MTLPHQRTILFVGGGQETSPGIEIAKTYGLNVVVSDLDPNCYCSKLVDHFLLASTYSPTDTLEQAKIFEKKHKKIDAVICMATDVPLTVATVAEGLKIPGIPVSAAELVSDKVLMKDCFKQHDLPIPWYQEIASVAELKELSLSRDTQTG